MPNFWKFFLLLLMSAVIIAVWVMEPPQNQLGEVSRLFYFHIPAAWVTVLAYFVAMRQSVLYLRRKELLYDVKASSAAELGTLFCILATITGSIFAKITWGGFWNWDPRQTSILILLLIYGAYLALRSAVREPERKAALSSVYCIFAFPAAVFLVFATPRVYQSLHPADSIIDASGRIQMPAPILVTFLASLVCFTLIFVWMHRLQIVIGGDMERERKL
ncbi:MAG: cytochrome C biogenesis protein [Candidatus Zixiibacteriota bacterium]|nr:MAG: cytochrome C biogenesis protein [candidate division Zixibacteria bacterium]